MASSVALTLVLLGACAASPVMASSDESEMLTDAIRAHRVVIVSKSYCPYCRAVKKLMAEQYPEVHPHVIEIDLDTRVDMTKFQNAMAETYGQRTVPQVFIGDRYIGGQSCPICSAVRAVSHTCLLFAGCNDGPESWMGTIHLLRKGTVKLSNDGFGPVQSRDLETSLADPGQRVEDVHVACRRRRHREANLVAPRAP